MAVSNVPYVRGPMPQRHRCSCASGPHSTSGLRSKISHQGIEVPAFHTIFMKNIRMFGRVHELSLIGMYKMKTKTYFSDMELGMKMFERERFTYCLRSSHKSEVKELFKQSSFK